MLRTHALDALVEVGPRLADAARDRRLGAMIGAAVGDALGTTLEFSRPDPRPWLPLLTGPHVAITGGGPFSMAPGQVTDDTHMACCLAASIAHRGGYDAADAASRYLAWRRHAFDVGRQTSDALSVIGRGGDPHQSGLEVWRAHDRNPAGNGSLMRCVPIGALISDRHQRRRAAIADCALTHADPRCVLACAAYVAAIAAGIAGGAPKAMKEAAHAELAPAADVFLRGWLVGSQEAEVVSAARRDLADDLDLAASDDPGLVDELDPAGPAQGFVRIAFRLGFWALIHADSPAAGLIDVVNRGGDADTNGAIAGGLLGAAHGLTAIPPSWRDAVMDCHPPAPWDGDWHPRTLVAACAAVCGQP